MNSSKLIIGIDATNLSHGGGKTYLIELLKLANPIKHQFSKIIVWSTEEILKSIDDKDWIIKRCPFKFSTGLIYRLTWQLLFLSKKAQEEGCDVLFAPGGISSGNFQPLVTMSQNLLPFESREYLRYGISLKRFKLFLIKYFQSYSFKNSKGVIFLTEHAKETIQNVIGNLNNKTIIIPHGLSKRFISAKKIFHKKNYKKKIIRILYVSHIEHYKHQWNVIEALASLRNEKFPITLDLVGSPGTAMNKLQLAIKKYDANNEWVFFQNKIQYNKMHQIYQKFDYGIFASSCENLPITLLEMMGSGMQIACSNFSPMPEILGNGGIYFNPVKPSSIAEAVRNLIVSKKNENKNSNYIKNIAEKYKWENTAYLTFDFLNSFRKI